MTAGPTLLAALVLGSAMGCSTVAPSTDFFSSRPGEPPVVEVFTIEWWRELVPFRIWEYAPREVAPIAFDGSEGGRLIALTRDGAVRCLTRGGELVWTFQTRAPFNAGATVRDGIAYVPGGDGILYALRVSNGAEEWRFEAGEELASSPVIASNRLFVASLSDTLYAVDAATGKWLWQHRRDTPGGFTIRGAATPSVTMGVVYTGFSDGSVVALSAEDGAVKWERALGGGRGQFLDADASPIMDDAGRLYAASYKDGVFALDPESGDLQWHTSQSGVTGLAQRGQVVFAAGDGNISALVGDSGRSIWSLDLKGSAGRTPTFAGPQMVVSVGKALLFLDPVTGRVQSSWDPGNGVSAPPRAAKGHLYVLSNSGFLYALRLGGGD